MRHAPASLFVYGSLRPGERHADVLADLPGTWARATVRGRLLDAGWGSGLGYPGLVLEEQGDAVSGWVLTSAELGGRWEVLDDFEGDDYERVATTVAMEDGSAVEAFVYVARPAIDPRARFTDRVDDYLRGRPGYPGAVLDVLVELTGLDGSWIVADMGAGTGLGTEPFLANGNRVFAVEPNAAMREAAERRLGAEPGFVSVDGSAEASGLPAGAIDLVVVAQALHWFDHEAARGEFRRVLRPPGWTAVMWNARVPGASPFMEGYEALTEAYRTHRQSVHARRAAVLPDFFEDGHVRRDVENPQEVGFDELRARLASSSYAPRPGEPGHDAMIADLRAQFEAHREGDAVRMRYRTEVYVGRLLPGEGG